MGERVQLKASDGFTFNAYRGTPMGRPKGGVVLIQEVWGLNRWIRSEVDRYASEGYLTIAPRCRTGSSWAMRARTIPRPASPRLAS